MKEMTLDEIEPTPKLYSAKCRSLHLLINYLLRFGTIVLTLVFWYFYDLFYAAAAFLITYLVLGIVRSKMLHLSIPKHQLEYNYNDSEIVRWYLARRYCFENQKPPMKEELWHS